MKSAIQARTAHEISELVYHAATRDKEECDACNVWETLCYNSTITPKTIVDHMDGNWIWPIVTARTDITFQFILNHPKVPWDMSAVFAKPDILLDWVDAHHPISNYKSLSMNPAVTMAYVEARANWPWDLVSLCRNPNITLRDICRHLDWEWDWNQVSLWLNITLYDVMTHLLPWDYDGLSVNPSIPVEDMLCYLTHPWNWFLASRKVTCIQSVCYHPRLEWDWTWLSASSRIVVADALATFPDCAWDFCAMSRNPTITDADVIGNPELNWNWASLAGNPGITFACVVTLWRYFSRYISPIVKWDKPIDIHSLMQHYPYLRWDWHSVSQNAGIVFQDVLDHPKIPWVSSGVCRNPNVTIQHVLDHPEYPWNWAALSYNPNITGDIVDQYPTESWDYYGLCKNPRISMSWLLNRVKSSNMSIPRYLNIHTVLSRISLEDFIVYVQDLPALSIARMHAPAHWSVYITINHARKAVAAGLIKRQWDTHIYDPLQSLCHKVHMRRMCLLAIE